MTAKRIITADYTNWRGERRFRRLRPRLVWFGATDYHPEPQWFLRARDLEDGAVKDFALAGFHGFVGVTP